MYIKRFEDLIVWQRAHQLVKRLYIQKEINFPKEEKYGLENQLKRAAVSIPANIAEGCKRKSPKELGYFLSIAQGSLSEVKYYLLLCKDIGFLNKSSYYELNDICTEIDKMLDSLGYKIEIKKQVRA